VETIQKRGLMNILVHPNYFPNIHQFKKIIKASNILFEVSDNYQKQTFRNRTYIYGANGKLGLFIPVIHTHNNRELFRDIKISYDSDWMALHLKSLQSAYRSSPYFEYFEDDFIALYSKKEKFLVDFNINHSFTKKYTKNSLDTIDLRDFSIARKENNIELKKYIQVFGSKHGFISNLSILDLLFNEGNNSLNLIN
jgi:hypothetical protein